MRPFPNQYPLLSIDIVLLSLFAFLLCQSNWTGAFAYEFCFLLAAFSSVLFSISTSYRFSFFQKHRSIQQADILRTVFSSQLSLLGPLAVVLAHSFQIPTCRYDVGFQWFLLLPVISTLYGCSCGIWAARMNSSLIKTILWSITPSLMFLALNLRDLLFSPSLFLFHPGISYIAGPIYDEWIPLDTRIITFRLWTVFLSLWLLFTPNLKCTQTKFKLKNWWFAGLIIFSVFFFREQWGWFYGFSSVEKALSQEHKGKFVKLHHASGHLFPKDAKILVKSLDFRVSHLTQELNLETESFGPIDVYLYPSAKLKKKLTGTRHTAIGNPIQQSLHVLETNPASSWFTHELTHVLAKPFGVPGLGLSFRVGLLEGLATAMEEHRNGLSVHEWARAMQVLGVLPKIHDLFQISGFWAQSASRAYLSSGSFCRWLMDSYGTEKFKKIYRGHSFLSVYQQELKDLILQWEKYLSTVRLSQNALQRAEPYLKTKSIAHRPCPHDVAEATQRGWECRQIQNFDCATHWFEKAWLYSGYSPITSIRLAQAKLKKREYKMVSDLAQKTISHPEASFFHSAYGKMLLADIATIQNNYREAYRQYLLIPLGGLRSNLRLLILAKLELLKAKKYTPLVSLILTPRESENLKKLESSFPFGEFPAFSLFLGNVAIKKRDPSRAERIAKALNASKIFSTSFLNFEYLYFRAKLATLKQNYPQSVFFYHKLKKESPTQGYKNLCETEIARLLFRGHTP